MGSWFSKKDDDTENKTRKDELLTTQSYQEYLREYQQRQNQEFQRQLHILNSWSISAIKANHRCQGAVLSHDDTKNKTRKDELLTTQSYQEYQQRQNQEYQRQLQIFNRFCEQGKRTDYRNQSWPTKQLICASENPTWKSNNFQNTSCRNWPTKQIICASENPTLKSNNFQNTSCRNWIQYDIHKTSSFQLVRLEDTSVEFLEIKKLFTSSNKRFFNIEKIYRVENILLFKQFLFKLEQKRNQHGICTVKLLFHGTKACNVDDICKNNFNWRLASRHKFGYGVYFTPVAFYATHYCDETYDKYMFVAQVMIASMCEGQKDAKLPPPNFDTTQNQDGQVIAKYEDSEFYPQYLIHYSGHDSSKKLNIFSQV